MRRIQFLAIAAVATVAFAACDEDKKDEKPAIDCTLVVNKDHKSCEGFCDDAKNAEAPACVVDPVAVCEAGFTIPSPKTDLCKNAADGAILATIKDTLADTASDIALSTCGAIGTDAEDDAAMNELAVCMACNVADKTDLSPECSVCVADVVACAVINCIADCAPGAPEGACDTCREEKGCDAPLDACQGVGEVAVDCTVEANLEDAACAEELLTFCDDATEYKGGGLCATYCEDVENEEKAACDQPL